MLLEALEDDRRAATDGKTEPERCPPNLTVEHVLPQSWQTYWPLPDHLADDPVAAMQRDAAVQTLGQPHVGHRRAQPGHEQTRLGPRARPRPQASRRASA